MTKSDDDSQESGGDDIDRCDGCDADEQSKELYICQACALTLCSGCWKTQTAHKSKRKSSTRLEATVHEKTKLSTIKLVQPAFSTPADESTIEARLAEDADAAWFGVNFDKRDNTPLFFHDHGRYAELMEATSDSPAIAQQDATERDLPLPSSRRTPSLVSFVGQTGAGKSTLINLLIKVKESPGLGTAQCPVVGVSGQEGEVSTSEDVHLYPDTSSFLSETPILYADCEGLDGGERLPLATTSRNKRGPPELEQRSDDEMPFFRARYHSKHELQWAKSQEERTRRFAVSRFYPRLLFTFSDVVVFVHRNSRVIEPVFEQLIEWAAAALETTCNQPILPYAIIVLNASEHDINPMLWNVDFATKSLLESLAETIDRTPAFVRHAKFWRDRHKDIQNVKDLILCYYSDVRVVRLPTSRQSNLVLDQGQKLYGEIENCCRNARERRSDLRMLLTADQLQSYLQDAFDHYSRSLKIPFDFVQASFLHNPIPFNFGGSILKLAIAMLKGQKAPDANTIFKKLGNLVASCIMLDAVRHSTPGTASLIFPQYLDYLDEALERFCEGHWPCEYVMHGITTGAAASMEYGLGERPPWNTVQSSSLTYRCVNVRNGHGSKGHQYKDGSIFAPGNYKSKFSFENNRDELHAGVYFRLEYLLDQLADRTRRGESQEGVAAEMHRSNVMEFFHKPSNRSGSINLHNHSVCWCCLFEAPEHILSCGHALCTPCVKAYGRHETRTSVRIHECPFESYTGCQPRSIYIMPETAGIRMLVLDDGGVRGIIQLEILRLIEKELDSKLPIKIFFDMIIGKGSGSVIALSLLTNHWTIADRIANVLRIFKQSFSSSNRRTYPRIKHPTCRYRPKALEQSLREAFTENQTLLRVGVDGRVGTTTKIAIPVVSSTGKKVLFTNYIRRSAINPQYDLYSPEESKQEMKVWEAARAAMAHPYLFKPLKHATSKQAYSNEERDVNPIMIADSEFKTIWRSSQAKCPDFVLSLGTGLSTSQSASFVGMETPAKSSKHTRLLISGRNKRKVSPRFDKQCEQMWTDYLHSLDIGSATAGKYIRLNIKAFELPAIDNFSSVELLRDMVKTQTDLTEIRKVASRLIANLFYFETVGEMEKIGNDFFLRGEILCRIPDETPEIREVGRLLKEGRFQSTGFIIQEDLCEQQRFDIQAAVYDMIHNLRFLLPEVKIHISPRCGQFDVMLCLKNTEKFSISGFPRSILGKGAQTPKHTRESSSSTTGIGPRRQWTPPNPARHSSFYPGLEVSDGSHSIPRSTTSPITPVPAASRHSSTRQPQELAADDAREPREIEQAMELQLERERIREEEVTPLVQKIRRLETELTSINTRLQSPSSISPPQSDGGGSGYFDDTPLISFDDSLNPTRTSTVRQENRKPDEDSTAEGPQDS